MAATKKASKGKAKAKAKPKAAKAKTKPRNKTPGVVANRKAARGISKKSHRVLVSCPEDVYKKAVKAGLVFSQVFQKAILAELVAIGAIEAPAVESGNAGGVSLNTETATVEAVPYELAGGDEEEEYESDGA